MLKPTIINVIMTGKQNKNGHSPRLTFTNQYMDYDSLLSIVTQAAVDGQNLWDHSIFSKDEPAEVDIRTIIPIG